MKYHRTIKAAIAAIAMATPLKATELKFANFTPPFHTINASVIEKLNSDVSNATNGELTVKGFHGGELGAGPVEQYVRAVQGAAEITWGLPGYTSSQSTPQPAAYNEVNNLESLVHSHGFTCQQIVRSWLLDVSSMLSFSSLFTSLLLLGASDRSRSMLLEIVFHCEADLILKRSKMS